MSNSYDRIGVDEILIIIIVGINSKNPPKTGILIKRGIKRINVTKINISVMAVFASLVLSTNIDIKIPIPIKPKPIKKSNKTIKIGLNIGTPNRSNKVIHATL